MSHVTYHKEKQWSMQLQIIIYSHLNYFKAHVHWHNTVHGGELRELLPSTGVVTQQISLQTSQI